jgi:hypothetical protein
MFFYILFTLFVLSSSLKQSKPKICIDCKYFIPSTINNKYGRCLAFPNIETKKYILVIGEEANILSDADYNYCTVARDNDNMCGVNGKKYKKKKINKD